VLLRLPLGAFALASDVVQVALVCLELANQIRVVVPDGLENLIKLLRLGDDTLLERAEML
jgi:hypothetical protein